MREQIDYYVRFGGALAAMAYLDGIVAIFLLINMLLISCLIVSCKLLHIFLLLPSVGISSLFQYRLDVIPGFQNGIIHIKESDKVFWYIISLISSRLRRLLQFPPVISFNTKILIRFPFNREHSSLHANILCQPQIKIRIHHLFWYRFNRRFRKSNKTEIIH